MAFATGGSAPDFVSTHCSVSTHFQCDSIFAIFPANSPPPALVIHFWSLFVTANHSVIHFRPSQRPSGRKRLVQQPVSAAIQKSASKNTENIAESN